MKEILNIIRSAGVKKLPRTASMLKGKPVFDSRKVEKGDLFVAVKGTAFDGHSFIPAAILAGAEFIVCENLPEEISEKVNYIVVEDSSRALGIIASNYFDNPSAGLRITGITGTNGKTTIASLLYNVARTMGFAAGLISTIKVEFEGRERPATHTTPDPVQLQEILREMLDAGVEFVFMEVSSHAIHQQRIAGIEFAGGIFTNLTRDHLDYHKSFKNYREAKKAFFDELSPQAFALINRDDKNAGVMVQNTRAKIQGYSLRTLSDFRAKIIESHFEGNVLQIEGEDVWTRLPGRFNAYNCLAVYAAAKLLGFQTNEILLALSKQQSVEGRFEIIRSENNITAVVDYAHTPDAIENVIHTINELKDDDSLLITVAGAGGDRDKGKRPVMAKIAALHSAKLILTSDNPRSESPDSIIRDMKEGLDKDLRKKVMTIIDRREAINSACHMAKPGDVILVAGKGHESYQEIEGVRYHFDDRETVREFFKE